MALNTNQYNRIINLTLYNGEVPDCIIRCPVRGRKPDIEINGTYSTRDFLPAFNLTVKNLYVDLQGKQYSKIKVEAGYEGNTTPIEGTIITMYQEEPGPEGKTVIQCVLGEVQNWLDATVQLNYDAGTSLGTVLNAIKTKFGIPNLRGGNYARNLIVKDKFMWDGTARDALRELEKRFEDDGLVILMDNNMLRAFCLAKGDFIEPYTLKYMSAPPQENTGDENGTYYTTITAPWVPELHIGDMLIIPSRVYIRNFTQVGGASTVQKIQVTALSFHFGTTGSTNRMTVQGFIVR